MPMEASIIVIICVLLALLIWISFILTSTAKRLRDINHREADVKGLVIIILGSIFVLPWLFTILFSSIYNFKETGQIGDTIGGITAPFINGIAAVLIYIAFKEQIKANDLIKEQQYFQYIQQDIHRLENDFLKISDILDDLRLSLSQSNRIFNNFVDEQQVYYSVRKDSLNRAIYISTIFIQLAEIINKMENDKNFMFNKLRLLYVIMYQDYFISISDLFESVSHIPSNADVYIADLRFQINKLEDLFSEI